MSQTEDIPLERLQAIAAASMEHLQEQIEVCRRSMRWAGPEIRENAQKLHGPERAWRWFASPALLKLAKLIGEGGQNDG